MSKTTFNSVGVKLSALLYIPTPAPTGGCGAIVMAHGFSALKEMALPYVASRFQAAGFVVLLFDYRCQGESEGEPRGKINWQEQVEDFKNAITFVSSLPEVNKNKIGIFGTSYSGAHVIQVGAYDSRVKVIVSQVPSVDLYETFKRFNTPEGFQQLFGLFVMDREQRYKTGKSGMLPVVSTDGKSVLPDMGSYNFFMQASKTATNWVNQVTIESVEIGAEYDVSAIIHRVSPKPLLMILAGNDTVTLTDLQVDAFSKAKEPKKLVLFPNATHFEVYSGELQKRATDEAVAWFMAHLQ